MVKDLSKIVDKLFGILVFCYFIEIDQSFYGFPLAKVVSEGAAAH